MTDRMLSLAFAVAVVVAVALPQFASDPARVAAGLVYMLAGLLLLVAAPRPGRARVLVRVPRLVWWEDRR
jgi:uncharacterized protein (DUF58 family)